MRLASLPVVLVMAVGAGCGDDQQASAPCRDARKITAQSLRDPADLAKRQPDVAVTLETFREDLPQVPLRFDKLNVTSGDAIITLLSLTSQRNRLDAQAFYDVYSADERVPVGGVTGRSNADRGAGVVMAPNGDCGFVLVVSEDVRLARDFAEDLRLN